MIAEKGCKRKTYETHDLSSSHPTLLFSGCSSILPQWHHAFRVRKYECTMVHNVLDRGAILEISSQHRSESNGSVCTALGGITSVFRRNVVCSMRCKRHRPYFVVLVLVSDALFEVFSCSRCSHLLDAASLQQMNGGAACERKFLIGACICFAV